jgi:phosphoglucomutase/phosphomannomutase
MDLLAQAVAGIRTCEATEQILSQAAHHLERWLTQPEFADYLPQLEWLIQTRQWPGLLDRFYQILPFGTGGRRGAVGIGPNRMNPWTLGASVQGHCEYLHEQFPGVAPLKVIVAYDVRCFEDRGRNYNPDLPNPILHLSSRDFAHQAVAIYAANGIHGYTLPTSSTRYLSTPELSFAIRYLAAHGGLNLSASHNPPDDNGGKFYDDRGAQPVPPEDQLMAELVDQVTTIRSLPWAEAIRSGRVHFLEDAVHHAYIELCRHQSLVPPPRSDELKIVFTPLHGVGAMTALETLQAQGFRCLPVAEQMTPDGQFPNVTRSPNPEVPESMDRAATLARDVHADLVLATDPDADRMGAMVPARTGQSDVAWRFLNGNEICALLTHFKLRKLTEAGMMPASPIVVKTLVTTRLVSRIARRFGAQLVENLLVGCKYIADVMWQLEKSGAYEDVQGAPTDVVIGAEESHGYLLTPQIRDKDGATACLAMAELTLDAKRTGRSVIEYLEDLWRQFGYFHNSLLPVVMPGLQGKQQMARMLDLLRSTPPKEIGGLAVTRVDDLRREDNWMGPYKGDTDFAARNFLVFTFGDNARIALRPSGTEPKAKAYIEVCTPPRPARSGEAEWLKTCQETDALGRRLGTEFLRYAFGLVGVDPGTGLEAVKT